MIVWMCGQLKKQRTDFIQLKKADGSQNMELYIKLLVILTILHLDYLLNSQKIRIIYSPSIKPDARCKASSFIKGSCKYETILMAQIFLCIFQSIILLCVFKVIE